MPNHIKSTNNVMNVLDDYYSKKINQSIFIKNAKKRLDNKQFAPP
jgi:hypothetical protein